MKVFAVIPVYNEEKRIKDVIKKTKKYADKVIVVDDGSCDKTYETSRNENIIVLKHVINMGKGFALRTGCEKATREGADVIVAIDGDGQHKPEDIPRLVKALKDKDIVFTYRPLNENMPLLKKIGNYIINKSSSLFFGIRLRDTQSGFKAFTKEAYKKIKWNSDRYNVESEMVMKTGKNKLKYQEIPIKTIYNDKFKGTTVLDGMRIFLNMFWWWLRR
jgi:glycosyltransferase involved in cell wall biosynthesis